MVRKGGTYVLKADCGCIRGAVVNDGAASVPMFVAEGIRRGYDVELMSTQDVRLLSWKCHKAVCPFRTSGTR